MSTPHKHAAAIHAWADGAVIEDYSGKYWAVNPNPSWSLDCDFRVQPHRWQKEKDAQKAGKDVQGRFIGFTTWHPTDATQDFDAENLEFRIKPDTLRYRVALMKCGPSPASLLTIETKADEARYGRHDNFVRWIDSWQEVEV